MSEETAYRSVLVSQLKVGMFILLNLKWTQHPFMTSSFKIKNTEQINIIRGLGLSRIQYDPTRSDTQPEMVPDASGVSAPPAEPPVLSAAQLATIEAKKLRSEHVAKQWQAVAECEKKFVTAAVALKDIQQNFVAKPQESIAVAGKLVTTMADSITTDKDVALRSWETRGEGRRSISIH